MGHKCPGFFDLAIMVRISSTAPVPHTAYTSALVYGQEVQAGHGKVPRVNGYGQKRAVSLSRPSALLHMPKVGSILSA